MPDKRKQLFNETSDVVTQNIQGLCQSNANLNCLDGFPKVKVVLRSDLAKNERVSVVSGGGAGHEPAHAGYVGAGMLAAAAVGDVFASPSADAVLAAIRAVMGTAGCLLVVMNYTGDRLNFGLAAELAKAEGLQIEMVIVGDDCSLPGSGLAGRRGIAGTVLVNKIAGAAAESGRPLEEVKALAQEAADNLGSMGIATQVCGVPGEPLPRSLGNEEVEMGMGIHGEPGAYKRSMSTAHEMVEEVVSKILEYQKWPIEGAEYALMVNNMGTASSLELGCLLYSAAESLQSKGVSIARMYNGTFMTATDMSGFSISLMRLKQKWKQLLDLEAQVAAWPNIDSSFLAEKAPFPMSSSQDKSFKRPGKLSEFGQKAEACLRAVSESLISAASQLDEWDRSVGDGDCGATVKRGAAAIRDALKDGSPLNDASQLCHQLAGCMSAMGGTSGAVYNIFFTSAANVGAGRFVFRVGALPAQGAASAKEIGAAFQAGAEKIMLYGGAKAGSRTMLDALLPASEAFSSAVESGEHPNSAAKKAAEAAERGAESTKSMAAGAGRSSYVPESQLKDIPDPGAKAVATWLGAISSALQSRNVLPH